MSAFHPNSNWTEERVEQLRQLVSKGYSAGQIKNTMGGITRNAVIGKIKRLGLQLQGKPGGWETGGGKRRSKYTRKTIVEVVQANEPEAIGVLNNFPEKHSCKFIHGAPGETDWRCCGHPTAHPMLSWCDYHLKIVKGAGTAAERNAGYVSQLSRPSPTRVFGVGVIEDAA